MRSNKRIATLTQTLLVMGVLAAAMPAVGSMNPHPQTPILRVLQHLHPWCVSSGSPPHDCLFSTLRPTPDSESPVCDPF